MTKITVVEEISHGTRPSMSILSGQERDTYECMSNFSELVKDECVWMHKKGPFS